VRLTSILPTIAPLYPTVDKSNCVFELIEVGPRVAAPEFDDELADYITQGLSSTSEFPFQQDQGRTHGPGKIVLPTRETSIRDGDHRRKPPAYSFATDGALPLEKSRRARSFSTPTMRLKICRTSGFGDFAAIPVANGYVYIPRLAQHAMRERSGLAEKHHAPFMAVAAQPFLSPYISSSRARSALHKRWALVYKLLIKDFYVVGVWPRSYYFISEWPSCAGNDALRIMNRLAVALVFQELCRTMGPARC